MYESIIKPLVNELKVLQKDYSRIAVRLETRWGTKSGHNYLKKLLIKDRPIREGFPEEAYMTILKLYLLHVEVCGVFDDPLELSANVNKRKCDNELL